MSLHFLSCRGPEADHFRSYTALSSVTSKVNSSPLPVQTQDMGIAPMATNDGLPNAMEEHCDGLRQSPVKVN